MKGLGFWIQWKTETAWSKPPERQQKETSLLAAKVLATRLVLIMRA